MPVPQFVTVGAAIVQATVFAVCFLWVSVALGRRVSIWLGIPRTDPLAERALIALALGLGVLEVAVLVLGGLGVISVQTLRVAASVLAVVSAIDLWAVATATWRAVRAWRPRQPWLMLWSLTLIPGLLITYFLALTPALDADGLGYHLTVVKRWIELGTFAFLPTYTYSNMPMGVEALFMFAFAFTGDAGAKLMHFSLGVAGAFALYVAGKRLHDEVVGAAAATLFLFGPFGVGGILGWAYVEGAVSFVVVASTIAWLMWFETRRAGWLRASFAAAGIAVSFKITAALFPMGLMLLTWWLEIQEARAKSRPVAQVLIQSWPLIVLAGIPVAPWLLRATIVTGNPIFPMFAAVIPSHDFPPDLSAEWDLYFRYFNWGTGLGTWTLAARKGVLVGAMVTIALLTAALVAVLRSSIARATALVVGTMMILQVLAVGLYKRHWFSVLSVIQLLCVAQAARMIAGRWMRSAAVVLTLALSIVSARANLASVGNDVGGLVWTAEGRKPQRDFLAQHLPLYTLYEYANQHLPADVGVAFVYGCGGFHIDRKTFCLEIPQGSIRVENWDAFVVDARRQGLTHVIAPRIMADGALPNFPGLMRSGVGFTFKERTDQMVVRLLSTHGRLLASAADQGLYEVDLDGR
jgi:hypothetical protein